jgi:hypothetical protein
MSFRLEDVDPATDFSEVVECKWASYENPYQPFFRLFNPIIGTGPSARTESLEETTTRQRQLHVSDPTSHCQKVTDTKSGKIIAAALWKIPLSMPRTISWLIGILRVDSEILQQLPSINTTLHVLEWHGDP